MKLTTSSGVLNLLFVPLVLSRECECEAPSGSSAPDLLIASPDPLSHTTLDPVPPALFSRPSMKADENVPTVCVCDGNCAEEMVSAPVEVPIVKSESPVPVPAPIGALPRMSGRLNVVAPSPEPYVVPMAANKRRNSDLDTESPSQINQPSGEVDPAYKLMIPAGATKPLTSRSLPEESYPYVGFRLSLSGSIVSGDSADKTTVSARQHSRKLRQYLPDLGFM